MTTGMKGFSFLNQAESKLEKVLWGIALIVCFVLTSTDLVENVRNYIASPTITQLTIVVDKPFNLSNLTLCLPFTIAELRAEGLNASNCDQVESVLAQFSRINMSAFWEETIANYSKPLDSHTYQLLHLTHLLLDDMIQSDLHLNNNGFLCASNMQVFYKDYQLQNMLGQIAAILWCVAELHVQLGLYDPLNHCDPKRISWLGGLRHDPNQLCVLIHHEALSFPDGRASLLLQFNPNRVLISSSIGSAYMLFGGDRFVTSLVDQWTSVEFGEACDVDVQLLGHFKPIPKRDCLNLSPMECVITCRSNYVNSHCACQPIFAALMPFIHSNLQWCYSRDIRNASADCKNHTFYQQWVDQCRGNRCAFQRCDGEIVHNLLVSKVAIAESSPKVEGLTKAYVYIQSFVRCTFTEVKAINTRQFLAQLGGNLSLWLGASFLVLLHFFIFCVKAVSTHIPLKKLIILKRQMK